MFSCRDTTSLMTDERDGALSGRDRFWYRTHMVICGHCRAFRRQLHDAIELAGEIPREKDAPPPELEERLVQAFRGRKNG
jgi:hypothetical protein